MPELELRVGEVHEAELRGLGTAGYSWDVSVEGPEGVVEVRRAPSGALPAPPGDGPPESGSLPETFHVEAVGQGHVHVHFVLRRTWEQDVAPLEQTDLDVTVTA